MLVIRNSLYVRDRTSFSLETDRISLVVENQGVGSEVKSEPVH